MSLRDRWFAGFAATTVLLSLVPGAPAVAASVQPTPAAPAQTSTPVRVEEPRYAEPEQGGSAGQSRAARRRLPEAGTADVPTSGSTVTVGGVPIRATATAGEGSDVLSEARQRPADFVSGPTRVRVQVADRATTVAAGVSGLVLAVSAGSGAGHVTMEIGYGEFAELFGADYGQRLGLVALPACALITPQVKHCHTQSAVEFTNRAGWLAARVPVDTGAGPSVLAAISGASSPGATFEVSSLSSAYSWAAGGQGGSFSWRYPLKVPASLGGPAPELALTYDSGTVDGQTLAANGQASWVGEGWDLSTGGFVERSYRSCAQDGGTTNAGDLCWFSPYNATLALGGRSYKLIRDSASGVWKTDSDDALKVEQLFDEALNNGDDDGEHWKVTALDGTQYFFGRHRRYTGDPLTTDSLQRVPVWGNSPGEPCYPTWCFKAYRWNLDYVVDARGNSMSFFYTKFGGSYGFNNNAQAVSYDLYSYLNHIDYGTRAGAEGASLPPMRVGFTKTYRCLAPCAIGTVDFPDTPWDLHCVQSSCPSHTSPTFWNPYRLAEVATMVRTPDGSAMRRVNQWNLAQNYPSHAASGELSSPPNLWLQTLSHLGYAEDGLTTLAEPPLSFDGAWLANRVDPSTALGIPPYRHKRLSSIDNGVGGRTLIEYSGTDCPAWSLKPAPGFNPHRCFPQYHKPAQTVAGYGWFHKYVVTKVTEQDLAPTPAPDEVWSYSYSLDSSTDSALWAHDFDETSVLAYRTWPLWRGYTDVTTTHGPAGGQQTISKNLFYRGMHGDSQATMDFQGMAWEARSAGILATLDRIGVAAGVSGKGSVCLDLANYGTGNGTVIQSYHCTGAANQKWEYNLDTFTLRNPGSGRCLQTNGTYAGAPIRLWDCNGSSGQVWRVTPEGGLRNPAANRCLDLQSYWTLPNGTIHLWDCTSTWNQVWQINAAGAVSSPQANRCADLVGGGTTDNTKVQTAACTGAANQEWKPLANGDLVNPLSGRCLDIENWGTADGTGVQLYHCTNDWNQKWAAHADGTLRNPQSGKCLDSRASAAPGSQLMIWACNGNLSQQWAARLVDHSALQGQVHESFVLDGAALLSSTIHSYAVTPTALRLKPITGGQDLRAFMARETATKTRTRLAATSAWRWASLTTTYDSYGLPVDVRNEADTAVATDDTCTHTDYNRNTGLHLISIAKETLTTTCAASPTDADFLGGTHVFYDNAATDAAPTRGLPTKTTLLASVTGGVKTWKQATRSTYDANGRLLEAFDALDRKTTTAYSPVSGAPVTSMAVTGPMGAGWTTVTAVDPGHGTAKSVTDPNGKVTSAVYDPLGRLTKVWLDNRATSSVPNRQHTYTLANPSHIRTQVLGPNGNQISTYSLFDGRLRPRQTQTTAPDGKRTITDTRYDGRGLTVKQSAFYNNASGPAAAIVTFADTDVAQQSRFVYDLAGRKTKDQLFSNNVFQFETTTSYDGDRVGLVPPSGGTVTQDLADARGLVVEKRQFSGGSLTGPYDATRYGYDRLGRLTSVTDPANNSWTYKYDLLGRKYETVDPDAGTATTSYDDAGQVTSTLDARGQRLYFEYDAIGRRTVERADAANGPTLASWAYDTVAKGQLTSASRFDASGTYTSAVSSYDDGYRPLSTTDTVPGFGPAGATLSYLVTSTYRANGAPATVSVPAVGGLPAEILTYGYTDQGMSDTLGGQTTYLADTIHTFDGAVAEQLLGAAGKQLKVINEYQPATRRLQKRTLLTESSGTFAAKYAHDYAYDPAGNITSAGTLTDNVRDQVECFRYDHLRRLTQAWSQTTTACTTPQRTGADPYWRQWTFDSIGNRLTQIDKNTTDTTWTYQVGSTGSVKPHQVKQITSTGPLATPTRTFTYDPTGNTLARTSDTGAAQTLTWDKENHLATLTSAGVTTTYVYDASGRRLLASTPAKKTLYLPDGTELEKIGAADPLGTRHYSGVAVRNATGLKWAFSNHQASSTAQVDAITLTPSRRRFLPYGEPRGSQPSGWMGTRGYVDGTTDDTGLTHLGAREYDPTAGRFISADPLMDLTDPQQWHPYTYANASPVTQADPSGLLKKDASEDGGTVKSVARQLTDGLIRGWFRVNSAPIQGAWTLIQNTYQQAKTLSTSVVNGQKTVGDAFWDWQAYVTINAFQSVVSIYDTAAEMIDEGSKAVNDAKSGDWAGFAEHSSVAASDAAYLATSVIGIGQGIKGLLPCKRHSFAAATPVLMADGSTKPIAAVAIGDQVLATDPVTGASEPKPVTHTHLNQDEDLTDLTIRNESTGEISTLHTTWHHPFWNATTQQWTDAADLTPGTRLRDPTNEAELVAVAVVNYIGDALMHDLTVADIHTYYVNAGSTPILVHNVGPCTVPFGPKMQYEPNQKHRRGRPGGHIGPEPVNPQSMLDQSILLNTNSGRRIAYDSTNNEIIVFAPHGGGVYHGYVSTWGALPAEAQGLLVKAGIFKPNGKLR